jgi:hypothetical protein
MKRAFIVKGRLSGPRTIELAEPVDGVEVEVEVIVREAQRTLPPPDVTESPVAKFRRDEVDAALAGKVPRVEVVYEQSTRTAGDGRDVSAETGMIFARRTLSEPPKRNGEEEDTNPDLLKSTPPRA